MNLLADIILEPGGVVAWIIAGLLGGWLAGLTMTGGGYGMIADIALGLVGALVGGFLIGLFAQGAVGFWGSVFVAFIGACLVVAFARGLSPRRRVRG